MIKEGSTVRLVYTGTLDDGTVFGYAKPEAPMEFQTGMDLTIDGFEREISQMEAGEKKTFTLGIYDAYGEYLDHLVEAVPVDGFDHLQPGRKRIRTEDSGRVCRHDQE